MESQLRNCFHQIVCGRDCGAFSWLVNDVGGPSGVIPEQVVVLGLIRKQTEQTRSASQGCSLLGSAFVFLELLAPFNSEPYLVKC